MIGRGSIQDGSKASTARQRRKGAEAFRRQMERKATVPSERDLVAEARELLSTPTTSVHFRDAAEPLLRALADERDSLQSQLEQLRAENEQLKRTLLNHGSTQP